MTMKESHRRSFEEIVELMLKESNTTGDAKIIADKIIKIAKERAETTSFGSFCYIDPEEIREMVINNADLSAVEAREKRLAEERLEKQNARRREEELEQKKQEKIAKQIEKEKHTAEGEQLSLFD